jgi:cytochrome c oxidase subunit II
MTGHSLTALAARGLPPPLTDQASDIDRVWNVFFIGALAVAGLVAALTTIIVIRFRRRDDSLPRQVRENIPIEATYTAIPLLIVGGLFALTVVSMWALDQPDDDEADLIVEVTAFQWQWRFDYPESGASAVGTDEVVPELVLPADSTVRFELTSRDVIHSFWITGFRFKRDVFPHQVTTFTVDVGDRTGTFSNTGVCAEFCGVDHTTMRFSVRVVTPSEFEAWALEEGGGA